MKTLQISLSSEATSIKYYFIILVFFTVAFLTSSKKLHGQGCIPLNGFNCTFSNPDAPNGVIRCGTIITASVHITGGIQVFSLTFPSSFQFLDVTSLTGIGTPNPVSTIPTVNGVTITPGELMIQQFSNFSGSNFEVRYIYRGCNIYPSGPQVNPAALFFDCDGGPQANPNYFCANLSVQGMNLVASGQTGGQMASVTNSSLQPILVTASTPVFNGNSGQSYDRTFVVNLNSNSTDNFDITITDELDVTEGPIGLWDGTSFYPLPILLNTPYSIDLTVAPFINYITPTSPRTLTFLQSVTLNCPNGSTNQVSTVTANIDCAPCNNPSSSISLNGIAGGSPSITFLNSNLTNSGASCSGIFNYDLTFSVTGNQTAQLSQILFPINTVSFLISDVQMLNLSGNYVSISNYTVANPGTNNSSITIPIQNPTNLAGFGTFSGTLGWINVTPPSQDLKLRIVLQYVCQNITTCLDPRIELTNAPNNIITFSTINSCGVPNNLTSTLLPIVAPIATTPNINIFGLPNGAQSGTPIPFNANINLQAPPNPFGLTVNNSQINICNGGNVSYRAVLSLSSPSNTFVGDISLNGSPNMVNINGIPQAITLVNNTDWSFPLVPLPPANPLGNSIFDFDINFDINVICPDPTLTYGALFYRLTFQAICNCGAGSCVRNLGCTEQMVLVHCPGNCNGAALETLDDLKIQRTTFGWATPTDYPASPITDATAFIQSAGASANPFILQDQLLQMYPYDIFSIEANGVVHPILGQVHTFLSFELDYSNSLLGGDFFNLVNYEAEIRLASGGPPIPITIPFILGNPVQINNPPGFPAGTIRWKRTLSWDASLLPPGINLDQNDYNIELTVRLQIMSTAPTIPPGQYPNIDFICQFTSESVPSGGGLPTVNNSCDPWGDRIRVLIPSVEIEQGSAQSGSINLPPSININATNPPCNFQHAIGLRHRGGLGDNTKDFIFEFRPLTAWPAEISSPNYLLAVEDFYSGVLAPNYSGSSGTFQNAVNGTNLLPATEKGPLPASSNLQGLLLTLKKDCPIDNNPIDFPIDNSAIAPPDFYINQYAYLHAGHSISPSDQFINPADIADIPDGFDCSTFMNFPQTPGTISIPSGTSNYEFQISPPAAVSGLPFALKLTIDNTNNPDASLGIFNSPNQTATVGNWYCFENGIPVPILSNNAGIQIILSPPGECNTAPFNVTFEWVVFCDNSQYQTFVSNAGNSTPCSSCSTTLTFQRGVATANNLILENHFTSGGCELLWELNLTNPSYLPEIDFTNLDLNFSTGMIYQGANVVITNSSGATTVLSPTPTINLIQNSSYNLFEYGLEMNPGGNPPISIPSGATLTYTLRFLVACNYFYNNSTSMTANILEADLNGNTVCPDPDFQFQPIVIDQSTQSSSLYSIYHGQDTNGDSCCVAPPYTIQQICNPPNSGSITVTNPNVNSAIDYVETTFFDPNNGTTTVNVFDTPYSFSGLQAGYYYIETWSPSTNTFFSQQILIEDFSFAVDLTADPSNIVCSGTAVTLTASASSVSTFASNFVYEYEWSNNGTSLNLAITTTDYPPTVDGTYSVTVDNDGCVVNETIDVTFTPNVTTTFTSINNLCLNSTPPALPINSTNTPPITGVWSPANISTALTGTAPYTFIPDDPALCASNFVMDITVDDIVSPSITISASSTMICVGSSATFTATPSNGGAAPTYQWTLNGASIVGATNITYTATAGTNFVDGDIIACELTSNATCASPITATSSTITLSVIPSVTPAVSIAISNGSNPICNGSSVTYTATPSNGGAAPTYQWTLNGASIVGATNITYTATAGTNFVDGDIIACELTSNATCASPITAISPTITMTVNTAPPAPTVSGTTINIGATATLTVTAPIGGGITFQWFSDPTGATLVGTGTTYTTPILTANTTYYVQTIQNGCASALVPVTVTVINLCLSEPNTQIISSSNNNETASTLFGFINANSPYPNVNGITISSSVPSPINFALTGTFTVNQDIIFENCIFNCAEGSTIYVAPTAKLTLRNCTLQACNNLLWAGIENLGGVDIQSSVIMNAKFGLRASGSSSVNIVNQSVFQDNQTGILLSPGFNTVTFINSENTFTNPNPLLHDWNPALSYIEWAYAGIWLWQVGGLTQIDQLPSASAGTYFYDINCGIVSTNSNLSVVNCSFTDIADRFPSGTSYMDGCGVCAESTTGNHHLTVLPFGGIAQSPTFENCITGIGVDNCNAQLSNLGIFNTRTGILGFKAAHNKVIMEYNKIKALVFGIQYNMVENVSLFVINHNDISVNSIKAKKGIYVASGSAPTSQSASSNIKIQDNDVIVNNGESGIEVSSTLHPKVNQNRVTRELIPPLGAVPNNWAHIRSNGSDAVDISCNSTFMGNNPYHLDIGSDIQINQSLKSWIACNSTQGASEKGLDFTGTCHASTIQTNIIGNHGIGLYLDNSCFVGMQPANTNDAPAGNRWTGSYHNNDPLLNGDEGAVNMNNGNPSVILDNQFRVQFPMNTQQWPVTYSGNFSNWFTGTSAPPVAPCTGGYCPSRPAGGGGSTSSMSFSMAVALGLVNSSGYPVQTRWMLERNLMKELKDNDSLRSSSDTLLWFYNDSAKVNLKKLHEVGDTLRATPMYIDSLMAIINVNDSLLSLLDAEIAIRVVLMNDSAVADTMQAIIGQLLAQYQIISAASKNLLTGIKLESNNAAITALMRNSAIDPGNFNEFIEQKVNDIYLRTYGQGVDTLTNEDKAALESIIHICPLAGGPAIFRARAMYNVLNDTIVYNDKLVCSNEGYYRLSQEQLMPELKDNKTQSISFNIFPNPSRDKLLLMTEGNDCDAGISIFNTVGQLIKTISISKGNNLTELDVSSWTEGYYIIHYAMGNYISVKPFIKLK